MFVKRATEGVEKKKRLKLHETTHENDIRFRGPFSYQHFKIFGWLCIVAMQVIVVMKLGGRIDAGITESTATWQSILEWIGMLALPFLLISNFAVILNTDEGYKMQLLINGAAMAGICALSYLVFYRYIVGGVSTFLEQPSEALPAVETLFSIVTPYGFFDFNLFVDLFLCTLTMLFLNYKPRRVFTGKARIIFRLFALLPIAYEMGCMVLKVLSANGMVIIPFWAYPLLTVKPPMTFVLFVALAMFVKTRELRFRRHGKTHEEYKDFLKTRRNSWNFSVFLAVMLVIVSVIDLVIAVGFSMGEMVLDANRKVNISLIEAEIKAQEEADQAAALEQLQAALERGELTLDFGEASADATPMPTLVPAPRRTLSPEEQEAVRDAKLEETFSEENLNASIDSTVRMSLAVGFGSSISLIILAPLVLLFSYTRKPKNLLLNLLIPVIGVVLILFVFLEGIHLLLPHLPVDKVNLEELRDMMLQSLALFK